MNKVITDTCEIFCDEFGIVHIKFLGRCKMDLDDAIDNFVVTKNIAKNRPALKLVDARQKNKTSRAARRFLRKTNTSGTCIAKAILVNSLVKKHMGSFFQNLSNPPFPIKLFTSEAAALTWLKTFL